MYVKDAEGFLAVIYDDDDDVDVCVNVVSASWELVLSNSQN